MIEHRKIGYGELYSVANQCRSVLEIGCGEGSHLSTISSPIKIGVDGFRPLMDIHRPGYLSANIIPLCFDLINLSDYFISKSIECVIGLDVIEHFTKEDAFKIISRCESIAMRYVQFFIPVGNHPQDFDDRGLGNEMNFHRSTWYPEDMEKVGYKVFYDESFYPEILKTRDGKDLGCMYCIKEL